MFLEDQVLKKNVERAYMLLEGVHTCNEVDEKAQRAHMFLKWIITCSNKFESISSKNVKRAHMFLEGMHICSNEFGQKTQRARMFWKGTCMF